MGSCNNSPSGGFGGSGGTGCGGAGGGGGYSGGGGSYASGYAGGGGSYNAGQNQDNIAGFNEGHGSVVISFNGFNFGCTNEIAMNYSPSAVSDDSSCLVFRMYFFQCSQIIMHRLT